MIEYKNGNAVIKLYDDGTRIIEYDDDLKLDSPLNLDIRVNTECSMANFCHFCHESAKLKGKECDYEKLKEVISRLPAGIELAIGCNKFTKGLYDFLYWSNKIGYICNLTINQGHINRDLDMINQSLKYGLIKGLGISYRERLKWVLPQSVLDYDNTVFHVISGIDSIENILSLPDKGVKKVLILGEKNFGANLGKVDLSSRNHKEWYWWIGKLFDKFNAISFDNLALEQLNIKRFFNNTNWKQFNNGEHSFYLNAVEQYYSPSSRSNSKTNWKSIDIIDYFQKYINKEVKNEQ